MNSAERIRAFLDARAQAEVDPADTFTRQGLIARQGDHLLREADLEAVLQVLEILPKVLGMPVLPDPDPHTHAYLGDPVHTNSGLYQYQCTTPQLGAGPCLATVTMVRTYDTSQPGVIAWSQRPAAGDSIQATGIRRRWEGSDQGAALTLPWTLAVPDDPRAAGIQSARFDATYWAQVAPSVNPGNTWSWVLYRDDSPTFANVRASDLAENEPAAKGAAYRAYLTREDKS